MHDVYYGTALPPHRRPVQLTTPSDRIGVPHLRVDPAKVVAVVETHAPDRNTPFSTPDDTARVAAFLTVAHPESPVAAEDLERAEATRQPGDFSVRTLALSGGEIVGHVERSLGGMGREVRSRWRSNESRRPASSAR